MAICYCLNLGKLKSLQHVKTVAVFAGRHAWYNSRLLFAANHVCSESEYNQLHQFSHCLGSAVSEETCFVGPDGCPGISYEIRVTLVAFTSSIPDVGFPCQFSY